MHPDLTPLLLIIGGGAEGQEDLWGESQRELAQLRAGLGLQNQVIFCGRQSQALLRHYYCAADMVIVPSRSESFGLVALEALACARPVIATAADGLRWVLGDGRFGRLVPLHDVEALASAVTDLVADEALRGRLAAMARVRAMALSWESVGATVAGLYRSVAVAQTSQLCS